MAPSPGLFSRLWDLFGPRAALSAPYSITCRCGQQLRGERRARHQVVACSRCSQPVFILPRSPFLPGRPDHPDLAAPRSLRLAWLLPVLAAAVTLSLLAALFVLLRPYLVRQAVVPDEAKNLRLQIEAGKQALAKGGFQRANDELRNALQQARKKPEWLSRTELRELRELQRQAELLAGLLSQSLQELLDQAKAEADDEWQSRFRKEYAGKTILFDAFASLDGMGRPELTLKTIQSGEVEARLALEQIDLLAHLSLGEQPRRVVFGVRLARFDKPGGRWVVGFQPDSGILLTDQEAFRACAPTLVDRDPDILAVLRRQKQWVEQNPIDKQ